MTVRQFGKYASSLIRRRTASENSVEDVLARITDAGLISIPEDLMVVILEASHEEHYRKIIMNHLHRCLTDVVKPNAWKRLHAAMNLIEALMTQGSPTLLAESAAGLHFDVVQKLCLVERFQHTSNEHAQSMVRSKAKVLRDTLVHWRLQGDDGATLSRLCATKAGGTNDEFDDETESTCSFKGSVTGSLSSFDTVGSTFLQAAKPFYDFEDLMEWAMVDGEKTSSDSSVD